MSMDKDSKTLILIVAAGLYYMSKRPAYAAGVGTVPRGTAMNSLPASIGTGAGQALGGALGGLLQNWFGGSTTSYVPNGAGAGATPDWTSGYQQNSELLDNVMEYGV